MTADGVVLEVVTTAGDIEELDDLLSMEASDELLVGEGNPANLKLRSGAWDSLFITLGGAAGAKALRDVVIAYLMNRRSTLHIRDKESGVTLTFDGPLKNQQKVADLVDRIASQDSPERGK